MRAQLIGNGLLLARVGKHRAAVLAALQLQGASTEALLSFDDRGWREVLSFCDRMQLTLPLALLSSRGFPGWVNERLTRNLADTSRRHKLVRTTYRELAAALGSAAVPHLVLKGFAQAPDFVKVPQYRMQSDIDLLTDREHLLAAVRALEGIGYESAGPAETYRFADHVPTLTRFQGWKPGSNSFDPEMPLALDVHHCLWNEAVSLIQLPEVNDFWNRRVDRKIGDLSFPGLSPVDHFGYFALHVLRELFTGGRVLHHALELATFLHLRADDAGFWAEWKALHSPRLRQMEAIPLALAGAAFSSRIPDAVFEQIACLPAELQVWMEMCGGDLMTTTFRRTRDGRLLQFLVADSSAVRRKLLWKAVSPGAIASPQCVASQSQHGLAPQLPKRWQFWRYPAYLASRVALHCGAVARLVANSLTVFVSTLALRRNAAR